MFIKLNVSFFFNFRIEWLTLMYHAANDPSAHNTPTSALHRVMSPIRVCWLLCTAKRVAYIKLSTARVRSYILPKPISQSRHVSLFQRRVGLRTAHMFPITSLRQPTGLPPISRLHTVLGLGGGAGFYCMHHPIVACVLRDLTCRRMNAPNALFRFCMCMCSAIEEVVRIGVFLRSTSSLTFSTTAARLSFDLAQ